MDNFTTKQNVLFYCYALGAKQTRKIDRFLEILDHSGVSSIINNKQTANVLGRPELDPLRIFAAILFGFATGSSSLRELETSCMYDTRFMYIMDGESPSHISFGRFINRVVKPNQEKIFSSITSEIFRHFSLEMDDCFIDGTKIRADANKYKFVWKPTTLHEKLSVKTRNLLSTMGLSRGVPSEGFIHSSLIAQKISEADSMLESKTTEERKAFSSMTSNLVDYLEKTLEYEEKEKICGPDRTSYFKTDHDATAMCLKEDYYSGLGSKMHPAYQVQTVVSSGMIVSFYISQDRTDIYTFVPAFDMFHRMYGMYPKRIGADSGYGCQTNYQYCMDHGIEGFLKYQSWAGECSGRNPAVYELNNDGTITCLGGRSGMKTSIPERHHKYKNTDFYLVEGCLGCEFMPYCRKFMNEPEGTFKVFEINPVFQRMKQQARDRLLSVAGIEMRVNRSCQAEGGFGVLKQDMLYDRFRRVGLEQVKVEFMLTALGFNIRKFLRYSEKGLKPKFWTAPEGTLPEKFRKPSAKRLRNRVARKRQKSVNEVARNYRYKN